MENRIGLPVTKSLAQLAGQLIMQDLGFTALQAAQWFRAMLWNDGVLGGKFPYDADAGIETDAECFFEVGFRGMLGISVVVHLVRDGEDARFWKIVSAKAYNTSFPKDGACTWQFVQLDEVLIIVASDKTAAPTIFKHHYSFLPKTMGVAHENS